jgi:hypothetical protein
VRSRFMGAGKYANQRQRVVSWALKALLSVCSGSSERVGPVRRRVEHRMALTWHHGPCRLTPLHALGRGQPPQPRIPLVPTPNRVAMDWTTAISGNSSSVSQPSP